MRKLFTTFKTLLLGGLLFSSTFVDAQTIPGASGSYPLTSNRIYTYGSKPSSPSVSDAINAYNSWKSTFVTSDCGVPRVIFDFYPGGLGATDRSETVSEGIAYGMLLAAYAGDRSLFDGLWSFYKGRRNSNGVMNWKIKNCNQVVGANGASDAELDVAMALIVASYQWQSDAYLNDAKSMIKIIREKEFEGSILKPGDMFGGSQLTNPSYNSPAYYRVFKTFDGNATFWDNAANQGYVTIAGSPGASRGLVPDWSTAAGGYSSQAGQYTDQGRNFFFDAIRTPFRSAIDYLWHGNAQAKAYLDKFTAWAKQKHGNSYASIGSKYNMNGDVIQSYNNATFSACFAVAAMSTNDQTYVNAGYDHLKNIQVGNGEYFNATFKALGLFVMTGNFYLPPPDACASPELGADKSLCAGSPQVLNAGITGATYTWRKDGVTISGATSQTYNVTTAGEYEVVTNLNGCVRRDKVNVGGATIKADFIGISGPGSIIIDNKSTGGISSYAWELNGVSQPDTDAEPIFEGLSAGIYDVKLTVNNTGFGCSGPASTVTKKVAIGDGEGVALDDFNGLYDKGINLYTYGATSTVFDPFPVTYCSKQDELDGNDPVCQNHRCSYVDLKCNGTTAAGNWASMEFEFFGDGPFDLSTGAFVSIKMSATAPVNVQVRLGTPSGTKTFLSTARIAAVTTTEQVFTFDFTDVLTGDVDGVAGTIPAWNAVNKLTLRPYVSTPGYTGTISIDYVIVGSKALSAPTFDIRKDEFGYIDYGNYLPKYYPNDPAYATCDESISGCYGAVPDWEREVIACGPTATVNANSCLATEVRWFKGSSLVATGDQAALAPGDYTVELIGPGGTTRDVVKVIGSNPVAAFSIDNVNYDATFINQSTGFNKHVWNYGDAANNLPGSTTWDIGYHSYETAGEGTYTVSLTVTDTICGLSDVETKQLDIACNVLPGVINVIDSLATLTCAGLTASFEIEEIDNADEIAWYYGAGSVSLSSETSVVITLDINDESLTVEGYNVCGKSSRNIIVPVIGVPVNSDFTITTSTDGDMTLTAEAATQKAGDSYAWDYGDGATGSGASISHLYAENNRGTEFDVCMTQSNKCGVADETCFTFTPQWPVGIVNFNENSLELYPTTTTNNITLLLDGQANVTISDVLGNTVSETSISNKADINVANLKAGMYILSVKQGDAVVNKRFIKE